MPSLACLESIRSAGELNRLLIAIQGLQGANGRARRDRVGQALADQTFQAGPAQLDLLLDLALHFRLVHVRDTEVSITPTGLTFLGQNEDEQYEITEGQRDLLVQSILFGRNQLSAQFELILPDFAFSAPGGRYETSNAADSGRLRALEIRLFCSAIGLIVDGEGGIRFLDPVFNTLVARRIRIYRQAGWDGTEPTDEDLERATHAEELVYADERRRLDDAGFPELVRRVQHVAAYNAAAGFDVQSFEGEGSRPENPDRFIEVKASRRTQVHFVLTGNELRKARELRAQYRIVFLGGHELGRTLEHCQVTVISDPIDHIFDRDRFTVDAAKLHVTARTSDGVNVAEAGSRRTRKRR